MYGILFDMPDASTTLAEAGKWAKPIFSDFSPLIYAILGIAIIAVLIGFVLKIFK